MLTDLLSTGIFDQYYDALRTTFTLATFAELYYAAIPWLAFFAPAMAMALLICCVYLLQQWMKRPAMSIGQRWKSWRRERAMRKDRFNDQFTVLQTRLLEWIEAEVNSGMMTREEANGWYKGFALAGFKELRHCIEKPKTLKEKVMWWRENQERDADGKIIPLPLPKEKGGNGKKGTVVKSRRA